VALAVIQVQRVRVPDSNHHTWLVIGSDYFPIEPIRGYLRYLENLEKSPNTIKSYAGHLKQFWDFLESCHLDWKDVTLNHLAEFIHWLRWPKQGVLSIQSQQASRTERTINAILSAVHSFYEFQQRLGAVEIELFHHQFRLEQKYKPFLHHISKEKAVQRKLLKLKEPKRFVGCLKSEEVRQVVDACNRVRDKFLVCLLYETGLRIGEALGLRHEDIYSTGENEIHIVPRVNNFNKARAKSAEERVVHITKELMQLYADYLINEYPEDVDCDYVFINIWEGECGVPMTYSAVDSLFRRLRRKTGLVVRPHLLRHTHETELVRAGWDIAYVQRRLGHAHIQTTINTYIHLNNDDLKKAYQDYLSQRGTHALE